MPKEKNKENADRQKMQTEGTPLSGTSWIDIRIISILAVIYIIGIAMVLTVPHLEPVFIPAETFWLFGLSLLHI